MFKLNRVKQKMSMLRIREVLKVQEHFDTYVRPTYSNNFASDKSVINLVNKIDTSPRQYLN